MTTARDGGRDAFGDSAPVCLPEGARDDFGCGRRDGLRSDGLRSDGLRSDGLRSDLAALRLIDMKFPKRESHNEDSARPGPAQRRPPKRAKRLSYGHE
jgi:hypothetical protein